MALDSALLALSVAFLAFVASAASRLALMASLCIGVMRAPAYLSGLALTSAKGPGFCAFTTLNNGVTVNLPEPAVRSSGVERRTHG